MGKIKCNDTVSREYCYLYVNIIRSYMCLGSNRQLWSRGLRCMCKINDYTVQHGFLSRAYSSYKQTAKPRNSDVEGTAQGNYL